VPPAKRRLAHADSPVGSPLSRRVPTLHDLVVAEVRPLTDDATSVTFEVPDELREQYRFVQGQHVVLVHTLGSEELRRSYSISAPLGAKELRVAVKRQAGGRFSTWLTTELRPGDVLGVMTPSGRFFTELNPAAVQHYGAVAGGSGITPIFSNIATILEVERRSRVSLLYVNREPSSVMLATDLDDLLARHPDRLVVHHHYSRASGAIGGRLGGVELQVLLDGALRATSIHEWLLCGPEGLLDDVSKALAGLGVDARSVHRELFGHAPGVDDAPVIGPEVDSQVTAVLNGTSTSFELSSSGISLLDALLPLRPEAPYACREGVCATCRALVVEGEVVMKRASGLDQNERRAGYVLTCQAHPAATRVVLDYDR
jgi:ring-1,2-phenylacetyl-CoA epoxidase subunit PaaE